MADRPSKGLPWSDPESDPLADILDLIAEMPDTFDPRTVRFWSQAEEPAPSVVVRPSTLAVMGRVRWVPPSVRAVLRDASAARHETLRRPGSP